MPFECDSNICVLEKAILTALSIYALAITIFGTLANSFSAMVCRSSSLKNNTTFIILFFIFIFKVPSMYTWNLDVFLLILPIDKNSPLFRFNIDQQNVIESLSILTCKIFAFMQFFSLHSISWLLTYMSVDQAIKVLFPTTLFFNKKITYLFVFLIVLTMFLLNFHIILFAGVVQHFEVYESIELNGTLKNSTVEFDLIYCYDSDLYSFYPVWDRIHLVVFCFLPFSIMIISNILIKIRLQPDKTLNLSNESRTVKKRRQISRFIIIYSFMFMLCTLPQVVCFGFFFMPLFSSQFGRIILNLSNEINFSFIAFNFLAFFKMNNLYRKKFWFKIKNIFNTRKES